MMTLVGGAGSTEVLALCSADGDQSDADRERVTALLEPALAGVGQK